MMLWVQKIVVLFIACISFGTTDSWAVVISGNSDPLSSVWKCWRKSIVSLFVPTAPKPKLNSVPSGAAISSEKFQHLLYHELPVGMPSGAGSGAELLKKLEPYTDLDFRKMRSYFKSEAEFGSAFEYAAQIGFTADELRLFLKTQGFHHGFEMMFEQFRATGISTESFKELLSKSSTRTFQNAESNFIRELRFENQPIVSLYRGTVQSEQEVRRLFKMDWSEYSELPNPKVKGNPFDFFSGGKYFSIDRAVGQNYALARSVEDHLFYHFMIEVKVPREIVSKRNKMAQWHFAEFQYDPIRVKPEEVEAVTLYFQDSNSIRVPGELLRSRDSKKLYQYLIEKGLDAGAAKRLTEIVP